MHTLMLWNYSLDDAMGKLAPIQLDSQIYQLDDVSNTLPGGVYTTFRTYKKFFTLPLIDHIERLEHSINIKGESVKINPELLHQNLRFVIKQHPALENRIRVTLVQPNVRQEKVYLAVEELITPAPEFYHSGVYAETVSLERSKPDVKDTEFIKSTKTLRESLTNGINEVLLVNHQGKILEGLTSNFFAISKHGLLTSGEGVLQGITRRLVLEAAVKMDIPVDFSGIYLKNLNSVSEAFITSASRGILPVVKINQNDIADGKPGRLTQQIANELNKLIGSLIEPI